MAIIIKLSTAVKEHMVWLLVTDGLIIWGHFVFGENPSYKLNLLDKEKN